MTWFALFVIIHASLVTLLAMNVSRLRMTLKIANGDGGDKRMKAAIRAHGNAVEHVLLFSLPLLALVLLGAGDALLAVLVLGFAVARILHALGMLRSIFNFRRIGAGIAYLWELLAIGALAVQLLAA